MSQVYTLDRGSVKIVSVGGLSLFALALEVEIADTRRAACGGIRNALNLFGVESLPPSKFFEPNGFVLAFMEMSYGKMKEGSSWKEDQISHLIIYFTRSFYSQSSWLLDCFGKLPPHLAMIAATFSGDIGIAPTVIIPSLQRL